MDFYLKRGLACPVLVQEGETDAVKIAAGSLRSDLEKVFGRADETEKRRHSAAEAEGGRADGAGSRNVPAILAGTLGVSADFDALTEPERIAAQLKECADVISSMDERMQQIRDQIETGKTGDGRGPGSDPMEET